MDDEVEENDDEHWSEAMTEYPSDRETSKHPSPSKTSSVNISESQLTVESNTEIFQSSTEFDATLNNQIPLQETNDNAKELNDREKNSITNNRRAQPRSECRGHSQDVRQCQKHFREMIEKQEIRNEELEQVEENLRRRLETLECSVPAVMAWNIWKMAQASPNTAVCRLMEKQLECYGGDDAELPMTPSRHWDERVRKMEAERKEAARRAEEAKAILAKKESAIEERRKCVEEAKKRNIEMKEQLEKLAREAAELGETPRIHRGDDKTCGTCECNENGGKEKWLDDGTSSVSSMGSMDLECFGNLRELAEAEVCMKRKINELERREEAYMITLQQADEMWSKMEGDTADTVTELKVKLDSQTAANQQLADRICQLEDELESSKNKLIRCNDALSEFTRKEYNETGSGLNDGEATVKDRSVVASVKTIAASAAAAPTTVDQEISVHPRIKDQESNVDATARVDAGISAISKSFDKSSEATTVGDRIDRGADPVSGLGIDVRLGDDEDIPDKWKDWNYDEDGCPPSVICDDLVESSTGTDDEPATGVPTNESKVQAIPETVEQPVGGHTVADMTNFMVDVEIQRTDSNAQTNDASIATIARTNDPETMLETDQILLRREELRNWCNIVDSVHHMIANCNTCSSRADDTSQLAEKIKLHLRIKGVAGVKGSIIMDVIRKESLIVVEVREPTPPTPSARETSQETMPAVLTDRHGISDESRSFVFEETTIIDKQISSLSAEMRQSSQSENLGIEVLSLQKEISPEVSKDFEIPAVIEETTDIPTAPVPLETESDFPNQVEELPDTAESQTGSAEESFVVPEDPKVSILMEEKPHDEKISKDEVTDSLSTVEIQHQRADISHENILAEGTIESPKESEDVLSLPKTTEVQSETFTDVSEKIPPAASLLTPDEDFDKSESVSFVDADETAAVVETEKEQPSVLEDNISIEIPKESVEETEDKISIFQDDELEFEDAIDMPNQSIEFLSERDEAESSTEPETFFMPIENEELILDATAEEDETMDETPSSFVTLRTPTPSKIDVEPENKDAIPSTTVPEYESPSELDLIDEMPSFETIVDEELVTSLSTEIHAPQDTEQIPESLAPISEPSESEDTEIEKVSLTITTEDEKRSTIMESRESIHQETANLEIRTDDVKADSETKLEIHEARSHTDAKETERPADKLVEVVPDEEKIIVAERVKVGKPYLAIAKVESSISLELPKSLGPCICKPRTCPLLGRSGVGKPKRKVSRVGGEMTQTTPPIPETSLRRMDEPKLRTISKRIRPSPEAEMWRRATIWSRRPENKSVVTTVCVDTQTNSALVREKPTLGGIDRTRKNDYTCSGARPRKIEHGGCLQRISKRPPGEKIAPVDVDVDKSFRCENFPTSVTTGAEKETAVKRNTVKSSVPENGEQQCIECGRPMTPEGTLLSAKSTSPTCAQIQSGIMASLKKLTSSISHAANKRDNVTCCECKAPDKPEDAIGSKHSKRNIKRRDGEACCPCPSETKKRTSSKSSRKKRRPEMKDQGVMVHIPKSTSKAFAKDAVDKHVNENRSLNDTSSRLKLNDSETKIMPKAPSPDVISYCVCEESSNDASIVEGASDGNFAADRMLKEKTSCDCLLKESVSKGSSCNCTEDTN